jgi:hypothetical protein
MQSKVSPLEAGGSEVLVNAEIDMLGKIVQFGRGMIEEVSRQMFGQFAACVRQQLEVTGEAATQINDRISAADDTTKESITGAGSITQSSSTQSSSTQSSSTQSSSTQNPSIHQAVPVDAAALGLRAVWAMIVRFFKRLAGKSN